MKSIPSTLAFLLVCFGATTIFAQNTGSPRSAGNGIDVDTSGRVFSLSQEKAESLGKRLANSLESPPESLNRRVSHRTISLKKLDAQIKTIVDQRESLPDAIRYLAGLTSIDYIVVVPEENDLLLIGPAEGWRSDASGNVVGKQTGVPILVLEDFLAIFRVLNDPAAASSISCAIEPKQETLAKLAQLHRQFATINNRNADAYFAALEEIYRECPITISGIAPSSRFARILVAADFKMKQIALGLEPSQVQTLPSYISLISASRQNISPRFWLVPEFAASTHDSNRLTWRIGEPKIRALSNEDYRNVRTANTDRAALNWCRQLESNFDPLARVQPVFGELRNNMKLALTAALIHQENLLSKANCTLTVLLDNTELKLLDYPVPKSVDYRSVKSESGYSTIVAFGGIEISPFGALRNNIRLDNGIDSERTRLLQLTGKEWWGQ